MQVHAEDAIKLAKTPQEAGVKFNLDTISLLTNEEIFPTQAVEGPVWRVNIDTEYGKQLIQIPILLEPGDQAVEINNSLLKLAKGKFICYRMNDFGETASLLDQVKADQREFRAGKAELAQKDLDLEEAIPILTKKFILLPNGKVRYVVGSVNPRYCSVVTYVEGDSLYKLKLDIKAYQAMRPERPERPRDRTPETQRAYQAASRANRKLFSAYLALGKRARAMPKALEISKPTRIWAVFEIDSDIKDLKFSGPEPLPWQMSYETFALLRNTVGTQAVGDQERGGVTRLTPEFYEIVIKLAELMGQHNKHPYDMQMAAMTISLTHMIGFSKLGDAQFLVLKTILNGKDRLARRYILAEMSRTFPPTRVTLELGKILVQSVDIDPREKIIAFNKMLENLEVNSTRAAEAVQTVNKMLGSEDGIAPSSMFGRLFEQTRENPDAQSMFVQSVRFQSLPENRLNEALVLIVENAGAEPLAAGWLNEHFLGAANTQILKKTLEVIAQADTGAQDLGPMFDWAVNKLFGMPQQGKNQKIRKARMRLPIPISFAGDGIFRALQHGDSKVRELAWLSLPQFTIPALKEGMTLPAKDSDPYQILLDTALDMLTTPPGVVAFFEQQPNRMRVAECLMQIVLRGSSQAQVAAVRSLIGSNAPLGEVMLDLSPGERQGFAMHVYDIGAHISPQPMVVNVLRRRETNNPVAQWFGDEIAKGKIPSSSAWVDQFNGEAHLLELVASNDQSLAKGAAAVMVTAIGGRDRAALKFREKVRTLSDQTADSVAKAWRETKLELFSAQLKRYEGHYQLILLVSEGEVFGDEDQIPMREIPVGLIQFRVNQAAKTVSLSNEKLEVTIGEEYHTLKIGKPAELKSFPNEDLAQIPLEKVTSEVVLKLHRDGTWTGAFSLEGGKIAKLRMLPVKAGTAAYGI